jgi:cell division protein FtsQ
VPERVDDVDLGSDFESVRIVRAGTSSASASGPAAAPPSGRAAAKAAKASAKAAGKAAAKAAGKPAGSVAATAAERPGAIPPRASSGSAVIVIGDVDDVPPGAEPAAPIDPRIRARRIAVRRSVGLRRLRWVVVVGIVFGLLAVLAVLFASPLFSVRTVSITGARYTDPAALQRVVDSLEGEPILVVDLDRARERIKAIPWVEDATVHMDFPDTVRIQISERQPVAAFQGTDGWYRVIDDTGWVIAVLQGQPADYLLVAGDGPNTEAGQSAGGVYRAAAELLVSAPDELRPLVAGLAVSPSGELAMGLTSGTVVNFGEPVQLRSKLVSVVAYLRVHPPAEVKRLDVSDPLDVQVER